jgi:hypothetical protein
MFQIVAKFKPTVHVERKVKPFLDMHLERFFLTRLWRDNYFLTKN